MKTLTESQIQTLQSALLAWSNKMPNNLEVQLDIAVIASCHELWDLMQIIESSIDLIENP
jgi:hypothetical protein